MNQEAIGKFIAKCRKEKGMTQAQLAEQLDVSDRSVSRWENGRTMPNISFYKSLCQVFDIQVSELLYAKKMTYDERAEQGEKSAMNVLATKSQLETLEIYTEVLIVVGIIIAVTLTKMLAVTTFQVIITFACGCFVWGFGLVLSVKIRKAILKLEKK